MTHTTTETYLRWLAHDAGFIELCRMDRGIDVGWYRDPTAILHQARGWSKTGNLFTTLNKIDREALIAYLAVGRQVDPNKKLRTADALATRYTRLFFDFDPVRPKGTSSTDAELSEAEDRAKGLQDRLLALDWPLPLLALSGNGWHLQYRTAFPNTPEWSEILKTLYAGLHADFSDDVVEFDRSVRNPARLCALYGSFKRKGPNTPERPHRQSKCWIPSAWKQVHPRQVAALANVYARRPSQTPPQPPQAPRGGPAIGGKGNYASLDVVRWFAAHDAYIRPAREGIHAVRCPWSDAHSTPSPALGTDTIVFEADGGWPGFHCHHSHCSGRTIRDVMALWGDADAFCAAAFQPRRIA